MNTITLGAIIIGYILLRRLIGEIIGSTTVRHLSSAERAENYGPVAKRAGPVFGGRFVMHLPGLTH